MPQSPRSTGRAGQGRPPALAATWRLHAVRSAQNFAHAAASARFPGSRAPPSECRGQPRSPPQSRVQLQTFPPPPPIPTQGAPSRLQERGSCPVWAGHGSWSAAFQMTTSPSGKPQRDTGPLVCPAHPLRDSHPGQQAQHLLLPSSRRGPHSPLSPPESSSGCRRGRAGPLLFPGVGRSVWARTRGRCGGAGIPNRGCSLPAALPAAVAAAAAAVAVAEIVRALCRPHLSYLLHHYRIPPNRGALQHFAT